MVVLICTTDDYLALDYIQDKCHKAQIERIHKFSSHFVYHNPPNPTDWTERVRVSLVQQWAFAKTQGTHGENRSPSSRCQYVGTAKE